MNTGKVVDLIFNNEPVHIESLIHYLLKAGLSKDSIKRTLRSLFCSNTIEEKDGIITIKDSFVSN